ncbi:transcriptional repressor [Alcaligenaceae bacterium A4P071]|mgnify:CR=1 FL=1|uniref:transcriptional repressor n=1 Tax=Schauerella aestuarii TaxID=2511204 RepID=UPI00136CFED8|nr:transcriptional repressor [Achromobacter aestuarii]MDQ2138157.1 transcriptional repressor [Alcaligenaceae bacterium B3P038]MDQ2147828.1 transcriptional repressor [Alcaligenaceae bacterium C4P045]MDQ2185156.1 transcriptional repressor [Alcaligenaceae bacterium A4P071]MYZ45371.1 transcriptional repressor [Achromobacter aestuarii]
MTDAIELKSSGLKVTFPRLKILDIFRNSGQRHLSAEDVYRLLMNEGVEMGLATVYRVLTQFEHADLLKRSQLGGNRAVYELNDGERHHGHLVCSQTGEVKEFFDPQIEKRLQKIALDMGYNLSDYSITLYGDPK